MAEQESSVHHRYIALDECIQASLRTLELVKHSHNSGEEVEPLSQYEIDSANVSLNLVIRTAESIKEKLRQQHRRSNVSLGTPKNGDSTNTIDTQNKKKTAPASTNLPPSTTVLPKQQNGNANIIGSTSNSENKGTNDAEQSSHSEVQLGRARKLSTPCIMPIDATEIHVREDSHIKPRRALTNIFGKGQTPPIHPSDVETGGGQDKRRLRFSSVPQRRESAAGFKMVSVLLAPGQLLATIQVTLTIYL